MNHDIPMFTDLLIIIGASLPVLFLFRRIGLPPIAGFVMTGLLIGPSGLGWVRELSSVESAAEIGVALLLFTVGLEFSLSRLLTTPWRMYAIAIAQILGTALVGYLGAQALGLTASAAIVVGFVLALSSSAIVLKGLSDRGELETPIGRLVVTICIVQDFAVVPMLLIVSFLQSESVPFSEVALTLASVLAFGLALYLLARYILPRFLHKLMEINTPEVVLLFSVFMLMSTAWAASQLGLSLAIGAFAAGLILSETEYYPQIFAEVAPLRTLFSSLFFVSVGMLLDLGFVAERPLTVLAVAVGVLLVKSLVVVFVGIPLGAGPRVSLQSGFYLAQIGEFSFLLIGLATAGALISANEFQYLIAASSLTLAVTPLIMQWAPHLAHIAGARIHRLTGYGSPVEEVRKERPQPAILIIGYGVNGRNVARVLRESGLYYEILESNPDIVRRRRQKGDLVHYGDVSSVEVLRQLRVEEFDSVVMAISDLGATRRAAKIIRSLNPDAHLIVRTRYVAEVEELEGLGADVVVPEEFETSLRIFSALLQHYRIPPHIIAMQIDVVRRHSYGLLRAIDERGTPISSLEAMLLERLVEAVFIPEGCSAVGKAPVELGLCREDTCNVVAILRDGRPLPPPLGEIPIAALDLVVLYGNHADLDRAVQALTKKS